MGSRRSTTSQKKSKERFKTLKAKRMTTVKFLKSGYRTQGSWLYFSNGVACRRSFILPELSGSQMGHLKRRGLVPPGQSRFLNGTILKNASKDYRLIHLAFANHPLFLYICIFFYCSVNAHQRTINALWDAEDRVEELENHEVESISTLHRQIRKLRCKYLPYYLKISLSYYFILFH